MQELMLIIHNVRSAYNVGSLFRTADGAGVRRIFLTGFTPQPVKKGVLVRTPAEKALAKTALGAEYALPWTRSVSLVRLTKKLRLEGFQIVALEQTKESVDYRTFKPGTRVALIVGNEVDGLGAGDTILSDSIIDLPMRGEKESLNVSVAGGIVLYHLSSTMERVN